MVNIEILPQLNDNYCFVIHDSNTFKTIVIDPAEGERTQLFLNQRSWPLDLIINTHHHWDHIGGNEYLKQKFNCQIATSIVDLNRISGADFALETNKLHQYGGLSFEVFSIPGHTLGHMALHFIEQRALFCGDTLFSLGCGRLFEGTHEELYSSLDLIKKLSPGKNIYCGHEYTQKNYQFAITLEPNNKHLHKLKNWLDIQVKNKKPTIPTDLLRESNCNPFFRLDSIEIRNHLNLKSATDFEVFRTLRDLRNTF